MSTENTENTNTENTDTIWNGSDEIPTIDPTDIPQTITEPETAKILEYKELKWNNAEHSSFDAMVKHSVLGWIPYTCSENDTGCGKDLWDIRDTLDITEFVPKVIHLDTLIDRKHSTLKSKMESKRESLVCTYDNDTFDCNTSAQNNMNTLLILSTSVPDEYTFDIRSATEVTHSFSKTELSTLSQLMVAAVNNLYAEYWELKDKLYKCTTAEEVEKINW